MTEQDTHFDLTGRVAVITGGARGIGLAISERFARAGASVAVVLRPHTGGEEVQRFVDDKIPLDVASLDMDWRALPEDKTGYGVNTTLFPDMRGFLDFVHGLKKVAFFNDHPMQCGPQIVLCRLFAI